MSVRWLIDSLGPYLRCGSAGGAVALGAENRSGQERLDWQRGGAEGDGVWSQAAELDRGPGEWVPQGVLAGRGRDGRQHPLAQQQPGPAADDDPLGGEQVDQGADADSEVERGLIH